jgi:hypothetical protein
MAFKSWTTADVARQLKTLGFGDYAESFQTNEITGIHLARLTEDHLRELGITSIGHRVLLLRRLSDIVNGRPVSSLPTAPESPVRRTPEEIPRSRGIARRQNSPPRYPDVPPVEEAPPKRVSRLPTASEPPPPANVPDVRRRPAGSAVRATAATKVNREGSERTPSVHDDRSETSSARSNENEAGGRRGIGGRAASGAIASRETGERIPLGHDDRSDNSSSRSNDNEAGGKRGIGGRATTGGIANRETGERSPLGRDDRSDNSSGRSNDNEAGGRRGIGVRATTGAVANRDRSASEDRFEASQVRASAVGRRPGLGGQRQEGKVAVAAPPERWAREERSDSSSGKIGPEAGGKKPVAATMKERSAKGDWSDSSSDHGGALLGIRRLRAGEDNQIMASRKLGDSGPVGEMEEDTRVTCQYCGRKLQPDAARRHIPVCGRMNAGKGGRK